MSIVERIKEKSKQKNTSMNAIEKKLGFGNGSIRLWDTKTPGSDKVIQVAKELDVSLDWLLTGKDPENLTPEEKELIELYRNANETGKETIRAVAKIQGASQELRSSDSKTG